MAEKTSWFGRLKRLVFSKGNATSYKKSKKWRWFFRRVRVKQCPVVRAPSSTLVEAIQEQRKHALSVAMATAAAAEAAVAAAHAAAEVVRLAGASASQSQQFIYNGDARLAAIRIQSAFRAYLARKAFRALKGLVKLQAIARGRAVRRQIARIKLLAASSGSSQSEFSQMKIPFTDESYSEMKQLQKSKTESRDREIKLEHNGQRNWDCSTYSKADIEANWPRKHEGVSKRERMKKYSYSHREGRYARTLEESVNKECRRWSSRLEQFVDSDPQNDDISLNTAKPDLHSKLGAVGTETPRLTLESLRNTWTRDLGEVHSTPSSLPRRSFGHGKRFSFMDEDILPSSPVFPTYMATTESAKAKVRSISMPKQRIAHFETCNRSLSSKSGLLFSLSYNGESSGFSRRPIS